MTEVRDYYLRDLPWLLVRRVEFSPSWWTKMVPSLCVRSHLKSGVRLVRA